MLNVDVFVTKCPFRSKHEPPVCSFRVRARVLVKIVVYLSLRSTLYGLSEFLATSDGEFNNAKRNEGTFCDAFIKASWIFGGRQSGQNTAAWTRLRGPIM